MLAQRALALTGSQTSGMRNRARKLHAQGVQVTNFAAGELDQDTSPLIKDAARKAIDAGRTQYTDTLGIRELRERWAQKVTKKTGITYSADEVGFTSGAKQALFNSVFVTFQPGDEVIIPAPYWVTFPEQVRLAGATPVFLPTTEHDFQIDVESLSRLMNPKTRGIILNTPHNPTGAVYGATALRGIAGLALSHNLTVIFDECYDELVYSPAAHVNIVQLVPEMKARTILIGSFSKTYCMAGWRAGFVAGPQPVIKAINNLQSHTASNACNLVQYAALGALDPGNEGFVAGVREQLHRQRETALRLLGEIPGLSCVVPAGAFYLFPDVSNLLGKSYNGQRLENVDALAEMLLEHAHIAVVPGSAFGSDRHVRISYAIPIEEITTGLKSLDAFVRALQ
ncbi:MAG: aspartate aminotransferase [Phycisphaerales bacterium]|nr:aspartate aminotransferase [Phycisphaerales bacterium]